jgi:ketosteroid isomerase-like protein
MSTTEIAATNRAFEEAVRKGDVERLAYLDTTDAMALP